jgi:hypothetical protein
MGQNAAAQAALTNQLQQYQFGSQAPWTPIQNLMGIIGSNNWGGNTSTTGTSTTTSTPSAWQVLGGLLGAAGSFMPKG